jgi:hypothetical protein
MKSDNHSNKKKSIRELDVEYSAARVQGYVYVGWSDRPAIRSSQRRQLRAGPMSLKPTYGTAVMWLIANERLDWPDTVVMVSELFGVGKLQILKDIKATLDTAGK